MSQPNWTEDQQLVIRQRDRNILVSAAAGSGKTAVLVERIISKITDPKHPVDIDRLLVMTFTKAAADEMKKRIREALDEKLAEDPENEYLQKQSILLPQANISTIHSFCTYLLQNYIHLTELDPGYRIGETGELKLLAKDALAETLEAAYTAPGTEGAFYASEEEYQRFLGFSDTFAKGKDDISLENLIEKLYEFASADPDPEAWLQSCIDAYDAKTEDDLIQKSWFHEHLLTAHKIFATAEQASLRAHSLACEADGPSFYLPAIEKDLEKFHDYVMSPGYDAKCKLLSKWEFQALGRGKKDDPCIPEKREKAQALRNAYKAQIGELKARFFYAPMCEILDELKEMKPLIEVAVQLTLKFQDLFTQSKRERNLLDFSDLEHEALNLLIQRTENGFERTETARALAEEFDEVMVDEYQDINLLQERLLFAVSKEAEHGFNRFMVGDIKQSIYGFRMARPDLFLEKYDRYQKDGQYEQRIDLKMNFRSREEVLSSVNSIFYRLMDGQIGSLKYDDAAALYTGATFEQPKEQDYTSEMLIINEGADDLAALKKDQDALVETEAVLVANRIKSLLSDGLVQDKNTKELRKVRWKDIAILLRSAKGYSDIFLRVLKEAGIPAYATTGKGYFSAMEVMLVLDYLRILDNPRQEIPYAAVLRSPMCGCTDEELAAIKMGLPDLPLYKAVPAYRDIILGKKKEKFSDEPSEAKSSDETSGAKSSSEPEKLEATSKMVDEKALADKLDVFLDTWESLREEAVYLPVHVLLQHVLQKTGFLHAASAMPSGKQRLANLDMLIEKAVDFEQGSFHSLFRFIQFIEELNSYDIDEGEVNLFGEEADTVRIMTIHKSKGLEFPILFLAGCGREFYQEDFKKSIVMHSLLGCGINHFDLEHRIMRPSLMKSSIIGRMREELIAEEMRLLYVAMTRAKEKLIMVTRLEKTKLLEGTEQMIDFCGTTAEVMQSAEHSTGYHELVECTSYIKMLLYAMDEHTPIRILRLNGSQIGAMGAGLNEIAEEQVAVEGDSKEKAEDQAAVEGDSADDAEKLSETLKKIRNYRYPYKNEAALPSKLSVSELKRRMYDADEPKEAEEMHQDEPVIPYIPEFMREEAVKASDGALRGTAYHKMFRLLDYQNCDTREAVDEQIRTFAEEGRLQDAQFVKAIPIVRFLKTELGKRMKAAAAEGRLKREQPFVFEIPASEADEKYPSEQPILIQGVIDAYFQEDDTWVLIDYKTDRVSYADELVQKYRTQLKLYQRALEQITDRKVSEIWIYSTALSMAILVEIAD